MNTALLVMPSEEVAKGFLDMNEELLTAADPQHRAGVSEHTVSEFLSHLQGQEIEENVPPPYVPMSIYWLQLPDGTIAGESRLRHRLSESLIQEGGHIGYMIRPSQRGKGYGTLILKLTLEMAQARGLDRVLLTCHTDNLASSRIIVANGGRLDSEGVSSHSGKPISRYWIDLIMSA